MPKTRDRRRLAALALAQCGAFAIVFILSAFSGSGPSGGPSGAQASLTVSAAAAVTPIQPSAGPAVSSVPTTAPSGFRSAATGTSRAQTGRTLAATLQGIQVVTLEAGTLRPVLVGRLNAQGILPGSVPENRSYVICLRPPQGWTSALGVTYQLPGWICAGQYVGAAGAAVSFRLAPPAGSPG